MTRCCLVRHGQTDWNLEGRYQGQSDVPLNAAGRVQAQLAADRLEGTHLDAIYASDLRRASETAEIIAARLGLPVKFDPRLREINQGEWEGQLVAEIQQKYTDLWHQRGEDALALRPPGGETVGEVAGRVTTALTEIAAQNPRGTLLIVSHGLALATVLCRVHAVSVAHAYDWIPENATPIWIHWPVQETIGIQ